MLMRALVFLLSFVFMLAGLSETGSGVNQSVALRRVKSSEGRLALMGIKPSEVPVFAQGLERFLKAREIRLSTDELLEIDRFVKKELGLESDEFDSAIQLIYMALNYENGIKREAGGADVLRFSQIKETAGMLKEKISSYRGDSKIAANGKADILRKIEIIAQMAGLWVTQPISSRPMFESLLGGKTAVMAVNARFPHSIPGIMLAAMETGSPVIFEIAMSESNLEGGYTGQIPQDYADAVRYWALLLGFDLPYAIHADHTTVAQDTPEAIEKARRLNQAQLAAGFTSFAIDPSALPAVREATQLGVLNKMSYADFLSVKGIGEASAEKLSGHSEFKSLKELKAITGLGELRITNLMDYIESKLLVEVLNKMTLDEFLQVPRINGELISNIAAHREFNSLEELKSIEGMQEEFRLEGMDYDIDMFEYLKTYLDLKRIIEINQELGKSIPSRFGLEVEVGHVGRINPITGQAVLTTPLEGVVLIESLHKRGLKPQLLATNNGTQHGNVYIGGRLVPTSVDINRTDEIARAIKPLGVAIAQHGTTGTPYETIKNYLAGNILKANVGTFWQNVALANIPEELFKRMAQWTVATYAQPGQFEGVPAIDALSREEILADGSPYASFLSKNIKYSIKPFKNEIDNMPVEYVLRIIEASRKGAFDWFDAFNASGAAFEIMKQLGWI